MVKDFTTYLSILLERNATNLTYGRVSWPRWVPNTFELLAELRPTPGFHGYRGLVFNLPLGQN